MTGRDGVVVTGISVKWASLEKPELTLNHSF